MVGESVALAKAKHAFLLRKSTESDNGSYVHLITRHHASCAGRPGASSSGTRPASRPQNPCPGLEPGIRRHERPASGTSARSARLEAQVGPVRPAQFAPELHSAGQNCPNLHHSASICARLHHSASICTRLHTGDQNCTALGRTARQCALVAGQNQPGCPSADMLHRRTCSPGGHLNRAASSAYMAKRPVQ